ncbi:hypothetical protein [Variovorax sp. YR266]|uniref:hypothetical protein n=1 Tax=Variovorax sp. YR266 TaxID=1884386 RepID=UPI00115FFE25|nr:hypothetical protein [Variovorax sp. YR266]
MNNEIKPLSLRFASLPSTQKAAVLVTAAFNLTIEFRGLRDLQDRDARKMGDALNELQHKLLSQALSESVGRARYPDDVLFAILDEIADTNGVQGYAASALVSAIEQSEKG